MFVRQADEGVCLRDSETGTPTSITPSWSARCASSKADAVWVGWGFVAEDPAFAELVRAARHHVHRPARRGDAPAGRQGGGQAPGREGRVPVAPWSGGPVATRADARRHAQAIGYPLIIKARSGGGGRGIRKVLVRGRTRSRARAHPGRGRSGPSATPSSSSNAWSPTHATSRYRSSPTTTATSGLRVCATARSSARNQKVIEESSSPRPDRRSRSNHLRTVVRRAGQGRRLPRRRHGRVPVPARAEDVHVPRGQHPAAGRAPDHRGHHRHRPGEAADPRRQR